MVSENSSQYVDLDYKSRVSRRRFIGRAFVIGAGAGAVALTGGLGVLTAKLALEEGENIRDARDKVNSSTVKYFDKKSSQVDKDGAMIETVVATQEAADAKLARTVDVVITSTLVGATAVEAGFTAYALDIVNKSCETPAMPSQPETA